jgi:hypothetical protein
MFAVKNMDANSTLLKLKLDMVYKDLPIEKAEATFADVVQPVKPAPTESN